MTNSTRYRLNLIAYRNAHHMANSGYARMIDVLDGHIIQTPDRMSLVQRILAKTLLPLAGRSGSQWYHRRQLIAELQAACRWIRRSDQIFHFLYGENSYRYLGALKKVRSGNYIICTYHTPPDKFQSIVKNRRHLMLLDAAIVFSREQVSFFSELLGEDRVHRIHHGVDVNYFAPDISGKKSKATINCLFVGQHLRDFDTLATAVRKLENKANALRFSIVTSKEKHDYFNGLKNVDLYHGIPDSELLALYKNSDIFVLPLLKTTANCAVQEAMACGLPVVATELPAVHEYMDESCALFSPQGDANAFAEAIYSLYRDESLRRDMSSASRITAMKYSLEEIAERTKEIYERITRVPPRSVDPDSGGLRNAINQRTD